MGGGGWWHEERRPRRNWERVEQMMRVLGWVRGWRMRLRNETRDGEWRMRFWGGVDMMGDQ